jgi:acyl carrier protein phosphodiesterase
MNLLAHAYLSFDRTDLLIGNMISDHVKGKNKFKYSYGVQQGITYHRAIDTFTDDHNATKEAKLFLKDAVGLYSGAFIDIVYDHFLANDERYFSDESLRVFSENTYNTLQANHQLLPEKFALMLPYMIEYNWLFNYKHLWGIERSFQGLVRRAKYLDTSAAAFEAFTFNYSSLQKCYNSFFPQLKEFAYNYIKNL